MNDLRNKDQITREDIKELLESIGRPGDKQDEKRKALIDLNKENFQGIRLEEDIESYPEF